MRPGKTLAAVLALGLVGVSFGAYTYYVTDALIYSPYDTNLWLSNGAQPSGSWFTNAGSLISKTAVPDGSSEYEVKTGLSTFYGTGYTIHYLRASNDAMHGNGSTQGTYYAVQYGIDINNGSRVKIWLRDGNGTVTLLADAAVAWRSSGLAQSVIRGNGTILAFLDGVLIHKVQDSTLTSGKPGVGGWWYGGGGSPRQLGPLDRVAPGNPSVQAMAFSNMVDLQWGPAVDDANGTGVFAYEVYRNGVFLAEVQQRGFTDATVSPATSYTYLIKARDRHNNLSTGASVGVTTLAAGISDARRIGIRSEGTYWGGAGEQIDMRSGNLTFALPLVSAEGRNGWRVGLGLVYNSQNWRKDASGQWRLGQDVGYGFGWRLMAGSITPMMSSSVTVHHWIFRDASGAEYRLDQNSGGIRTSKETTYVRYDANQHRLYGPDGTMWYMDCISSLGEEDGARAIRRRLKTRSGIMCASGISRGKKG